MRKELRDKIIAYNRSAAEHREKAADLTALICGLKKLPPGQLKKVLSEEMTTVLEKYGICFSEIQEETE